MSFRFRRSIKILPGVRWNIGKRGGSISVGGRGAHVNFSKRGTKTTLSLLGTGLSYRNTTKTHANGSGAAHGATHAQVHPAARPPSLAGAIVRLIVFAGMVAILARVVWLLNHYSA